MPLSVQEQSTAGRPCTDAAHLHLAVAGVDDVQDAVHGQRRLGNVGRDDALAPALRRLVKDFGLQQTLLSTLVPDNGQGINVMLVA